MLNRWQAIIWTNSDPIPWCLYAALGGRWVQAETKWPLFPISFPCQKIVYSDLNSTKICSQMSNQQKASIGSDNGLTPLSEVTMASFTYAYMHHSDLWVNPSTLQQVSCIVNIILYTVETLYNTVNFCWSTHKRHSIARPKGRGMGCLLWVQRATYCVDLSKLSSIKYLL